MLQFAQQVRGILRAALHVLDALPRLFLQERGRELRIFFHAIANRRFGDACDGVGIVQKGRADHHQFAG